MLMVVFGFDVPDADDLAVDDRHGVADRTNELPAATAVVLGPLPHHGVRAGREAGEVVVPEIVLVDIDTEHLVLRHAVELAPDGNLDLAEIHWNHLHSFIVTHHCFTPSFAQQTQWANLEAMAWT